MNKLIKEIPRALVICFFIFLFLLLIDFMSNGHKYTTAYELAYYIGQSFLYCMLYSLTLYMVNASIYIYFDHVFVDNMLSSKRLILGFIVSFVATILVYFFLRIFHYVIIEKNTVEAFLSFEKTSNYIIPSVVTIVVLLLIHAIDFYKLLQENKVKEQKIIAGTANAKFESLKNQIDPHFLFNSLNVLSSLIEENPENAQRFTTSLSKVYRYVLEQKDKELVSVNEELSFAKTYMNLLKMRFENSLTYEIHLENSHPEAKVVPLSLQLLLENTVKHNIISEQKPLHIKIFNQNDYLVIQNNFQKKDVLQDRQGVGLQNIVNRYGIISNRKVVIEQNEQFFNVKIPILTKQISVMETFNYNENNAYFKAKERVKKLKGFYGNLISYCTVIPILIFINLNYTPEFQWFWFSAGGWGLGLLFHAFETFGYGKSWEEKKIQEILNNGNEKTNKWN
ncbi:MAG: hypothetical protein RL494_757 [Bacteroidota bacterium]|jgi:sensor histidine kinase YesM